MEITESDFYRNEMDIEYRPPAALKLGAGLGFVEYIPYQIRNSFVSLLSLARPRSSNKPKRRNFPIDDIADKLDPSTDEKRDFWQKNFGVIMTHDIDTRGGYEYGFSKFIEMEQAEDMVSTFNIVPSSSEYRIDPDKISSLVKDGFDFGMHGLYHDGKLFSSEKEFLRRAKKINQYLKS